jgi:hypothetical protein
MTRAVLVILIEEKKSPSYQLAGFVYAWADGSLNVVDVEGGKDTVYTASCVKVGYNLLCVLNTVFKIT